MTEIVESYTKARNHARTLRASDAHISEVMVIFSVTTIYLTKLKAQPHFQGVAAPDKSIGTKMVFTFWSKKAQSAPEILNLPMAQLGTEPWHNRGNQTTTHIPMI